ncbi:androgen-binding protein homolog [Bubalus kerabau]|uniref:androgen-binding protein homolog n=1 Tax=Bubalus carabanensis TaxID=3119969 RepID=UPI00244EA3C1|nr:androgen-binding protein homolog [Bubalus carabanensis]
MKGALLLVAFLVTRELTFETHEACPVFYGAVGTVFIGSKTLLNSTFDLVDATNEEKEAIGKLQDCFNENGFRAKLFIIELVSSIIINEDCSGYRVSTVVNAVSGLLLSVMSLVR